MVVGFAEFMRACCAVNGALRRSVLELDLFIAEAGCGMPEKFWMLPNV